MENRTMTGRRTLLLFIIVYLLCRVLYRARDRRTRAEFLIRSETPASKTLLQNKTLERHSLSIGTMPTMLMSSKLELSQLTCTYAQDDKTTENPTFNQTNRNTTRMLKKYICYQSLNIDKPGFNFCL